MGPLSGNAMGSFTASNLAHRRYINSGTHYMFRPEHVIKRLKTQQGKYPNSSEERRAGYPTCRPEHVLLNCSKLNAPRSFGRVWGVQDSMMGDTLDWIRCLINSAPGSAPGVIYSECSGVGMDAGNPYLCKHATVLLRAGNSEFLIRCTQAYWVCLYRRV